MFKNIKIAVIYDWFDKWGGVERILQIFHQMLPQADFYTSYFDPAGAYWAKKFPLKTSFLQNLPSFIKKNRVLSLPFYPYVFESINFNQYHLVISITSSFAKGIITKPGTKHICYLLTPTRYLWLYPHLYLDNKIKKLLGSIVLEKLRNWDFIAAQRPDSIISISKTVAKRCKKYYKRNSQVVYPPFDFSYWKKLKLKSPKNQKQGLYRLWKEKLKPSYRENIRDFFLVVSRLEPYKKVDLVIKAFEKLPKENLIIVGKGSQWKKLQKLSSENIFFLNHINDQQLALLYQRAKALIIAQEEDFGYTALEGQFFGCPVIAYKKGGVTETIIEGKTGLFFLNQDYQSLQKAIENFHTISYNLKQSTVNHGGKNVIKYNRLRFKNEFFSKLKLL